MTRRILLVLLAFTATVLVAAVVPLTLDAANHDRASFVQARAGIWRVRKMMSAIGTSTTRPRVQEANTP